MPLSPQNVKPGPSEPNPYQTPQCAAAGSPLVASFHGKGMTRLYIAWAAVFALNLVIPGLLGWMSTAGDGRIGMLLAIFCLLGSGFWTCSRAPGIGFALVVGGVAVALSQAIPVLQIVAGGAAFAVGKALAFIEPAADLSGVTSATGGFVVTLTTGGLLMAAALVAGLVLRGLRAAFG